MGVLFLRGVNVGLGGVGTVLERGWVLGRGGDESVLAGRSFGCGLVVLYRFA